MPEYGYLVAQSVCTCCGANSKNNYQHHESCILNLASIALAPHWRRGFALQGDQSQTPQERQAFLMGLDMKEVLLIRQRDHLEAQTHPIDRALQDVQALAARPA